MPILPIIASALASAFLGKVISNAMDGKESTSASKDKFQLNADQCSVSSKTDAAGKETTVSQQVRPTDEEFADKIKKTANAAPALAAALDSQLVQSRVNKVADETAKAKPAAAASGTASAASFWPASGSADHAALAPKTVSGTGQPPFKPVEANKAGAAGSDEWSPVRQNMREAGVVSDNSQVEAQQQLMALYGEDFARAASTNAVSLRV